MSTKSTLLYGKNFHIYSEPFEYLPYVEVKGKLLDLPDDFKEALLELIFLHMYVKRSIELAKKLDEIDGGLFMFNTKTGEKKEFKG
jgi:hypothetical protein